LYVQADSRTELFRIRSARRGDAEAIGSLLQELGYADGADTATVHWVISHPEMEIFVAADARDRAIGMVSLSHRPQLRMRGRIATIDELVVSRPWRGRGVGTELLKRAVARAKVLSVRRLELVTHVGKSDVPRRFYESNGLSEADAMVFRLSEVDFNAD
jgi:GNAT superfamily N-acetyltransferase